MSLGVAIVTHRNAATIEACLRALKASAAVTAIRVVDNASDDETVNILSRLASQEPRIRFIANEDNVGFGRGVNQAVAAMPSTEQLLILNPDCELTADALAAMCSHLNGDMILGVELVNEQGQPDPASRRNDIRFWPLLLSKLGGGTYSPFVERDRSAVQAVEAISGAVMLMPRTLFNALRGFDEGYRLHVEDLDLCRRARQRGAAVAVCNEVRVLHLRGVSSRRRPFFVEWNKHRGLLRYFRAQEAHTLNPLQQLAVYAMIWVRFPLMLMKALLKA